MLRTLAFITLHQWRQHKLRLTLTVLSIALGVAVVFAVQTANTTLLNSLQTTIEKLAGRATLQITGGESGFSQDVLETVRSTPGVRVAEPVIETIARTALSDETHLLIVGFDTASDLELYEGMFDESQFEINNPLAFIGREDSIAVSRAFAERYNLREGDRLPVYTLAGRRDFVVRGFFSPSGAGEVFGGQIALMDIAAAQNAFNRARKYDRIDLMTDQNTPVETVRESLRERLPSGLDVTRPERRGQGMETAVAAMNLGLTVMSFLALTIGVFIIFNSFQISVSQRWKEIGILRALGTERANVQRMFLGEAVMMGVVGSLIGLPVGFYLADIATRIMSAIAADTYGSITTPQPPVFRWDYAALALAVGVFASLIAAWLPARSASRLNPILALHNIETRERDVAVGWTRILLGVALILTGLALTRFSTPRLGLMIQCLYSMMMQIGMILLLPKLIEWGARALRPVMDRLFGAEGVLAVDTMTRSPRRAVATVGALMIGLSFVFSNGAFIQSQKSALMRTLDRAVNTDLLITTSEQIRSRTYHFSEDLARRVARLPGVRRTENLRLVDVPYSGDMVAVIAHDMDAWLERAPDVLDEGDARTARERTSRGEGFLISHNFATRWNVRLGDSVRLDTPTGTLIRPVLGILEYYQSEKGTIFMDRELFKRFWQDDLVDYIFVNLNTGVDHAAFKRDVERVIAGEQRAFIYTHEEYKRWVMRLIDQFFALTYLLMIIAVFVAALGIINTLVISVSERRREFGVIRAVGGLRAQIRKMVLLEAAALALIGTATGIIAGLFNAYFLVRTAATMIAGFSLPLRFPTALIFVTLPVVFLVALVAAWWPARRAVRLRVVEAILYE
jgi:putative ABC transport system permease protein